MNCAIGEQQQRKLRTKIAGNLSRIVQEDQPFELKEYIHSIYNLVNDSTSDHAKAVDYARLTPFFVQQILAQELGLLNDLIIKGLNMQDLAQLIVRVADEQVGMGAMEEYLELTKDITQELREDNTVSLAEAAEQETLSIPVSAQPAESQPPTSREPFTFLGLNINDYIARVFRAAAPTALADRVQEAISWERDHPQYNVPNPDETFYFKVKRKIIGQLNKAGTDYDSSNMDYQGVGPVYLTAMAATQIPSEYLRAGVDEASDAHQEGVVLALTDRFGKGNLMRFDADGNSSLDDSARPAYYYLRQTDNIVSEEGTVNLRPEDIRAINAMASQKKISEDAAKELYTRELKLVADIRKYIREDKEENTIRNVINGGTLGYAEFDYNINTPLKNINFGTQPFSPFPARADDPGKGLQSGRTYFYIDELYGQPIEVERPTVADSGMTDTLVNLIVNDIVDQNGTNITPIQRQTYLDHYFFTSKTGLQLFPDPSNRSKYIVKIKGTRLDITTPEQKAAARTTLREFFNALDATRQIDPTKIDRSRQRIVKSSDPDRKSKYRLNDVLEVEDPDGAPSKFYVIERRKLHIRRDKLPGKFEHISIGVAEDGTTTLTTESIEYKDFVKDNFAIHYSLNPEGKVVKLNAYFTFQPTEDAVNELYDTKKEVQKTIDETLKDKPESSSLTDEGAPDSEIDKLLKDTRDDNELAKNFDQKGVEKGATNKQIEDARTWYEASPLSEHIPFKVMFNAVNTANPKSVATWALHGITLYKGSDYSDLYHESWHAFSQTFLTAEDKTKLYNETRKKSGGFVDHYGRRVLFQNANDLQLEEYLAEDFRSYMLNGKEIAEAPVRNSIFRKILNFLSALFNSSTVNQIVTNERVDNNIREIYEKLRVGNLQEWTFSQENVQFGALNKGMRAWDTEEPIQALSYEESKALVDTVDSLFSEFTDRLNAGLNTQEMTRLGELEGKLRTGNLNTTQKKEVTDQVESLKSKQTYQYTTRVVRHEPTMKRAYKYVELRLSQLHNDLVTEREAEENETAKALIEKKVQTLHYAIRNLGDTENIAKNKFKSAQEAKGLIGYHIIKSKYFLEETVELFEDEALSEDDTFLRGREGYDRLGNETSMKDLASKEVLYLLRGLTKLENGQPVLNKYGVAELTNFNEVWNRLARTVQNTPDISQMYDKIVKEANVYPPFKQLLSRLGPVRTGSASEVNLWTNFWQTFNLTRVPLIQMNLEKGERQGKEIYTSKIGEAAADYRKVGRQWQSQFHTTDHTKNKYVGNDEGGNFLNIKAVLDNFKVGSDVAPANALAGRELEFFNAMGFALSDVPEIRDQLSEGEGGATWYRRQLLYLASRGDIIVRNFVDINKSYEVASINGKTYEPRRDMNTRFRQLQNLEARYSDQYSNFMAFNAEGNTQFEHSLNNTLTLMVNSINNSTSYRELISQLHMNHLDIERNPIIKASTWLNSLYDLSKPGGPRRRRSDEPGAPFVELKLTNLSGVLLTEEGSDTNQGVASAKADEFTKIILDFHLTTQVGIPELMRHADKGTSFSVSLDRIQTPEGVRTQYVDNVAFIQEAHAYHSSAMKIILPHIKAELERIQIMRDMAAQGVQNFDFNYLKQGQNFVTFDKVLSQDVKSTLIKLSGEGISADDIFNVEMQKRISQDTMTYFNGQIESVQNRLEGAEFISDSLYNDLIGKARNIAGISNLKRSEAKAALIKSFTYNSWIHNLESLAMFYGDLAQYNHAKEEFHKRNAGAGSTGRIYRADQHMQDYINTTLGRGYAEKMNIEPEPFDGTMNTAVVQDNEIGSVYYDEYLEAIGDEDATSPYNEGAMNEGDAQGWISFDTYRILKTAQGVWSPAQEKLYQDIVNDRSVNPEDVTTFFSTIKAQYWGPLQTDGIPITAFHKFELYPLIPSVIKGTNLENLHNKMVKENVDYTLFESGSKVGTITKDGQTDEIYSTGRQLTEKEFTKNVIHVQYLKDQLEIAPEYKGKVTFSTQLRKLIEDGLYEQGKALTPQFERLASVYEDNVRRLTEIKKRELLKEADWSIDEKGNLTGSLNNLMEFVKRELSRQDLADHEIDFIDVVNKELKHDLSLSLSADKIERLLNAIVTKRLVRQKVNGEGLVQVSGALFERLDAHEERDYTNPTDDDIAKWGTNDLPTYHKKADGKTAAMKVKIALQGDFVKLLDVNHRDGKSIETIDRLNEMLKDDKWLKKNNNREMITMVGVRIPVQGLNSMEFMEVYEFLPTEAGNIIIPPAEIVAKSGSDFDIDKLTVMMPNISRRFKKPKLNNEFLRELDGQYEDLDFSRDNIDIILDAVKNDEAVYTLNQEDKRIVEVLEGFYSTEVEYVTSESEKGVQNELIQNIRDILELPENYATLVRPNGTDIVKPIAEDLASDVMDYNPIDPETGQISPTSVLEIEYNLYKHSSNNIGKQTLGLGAVDNTYNSVFNRIGARMNPTAGTTTTEYNQLKAKKDKGQRLTRDEFRKFSSYHRQKLFLPHNNTKVAGETAISLSHLMDKAGEHRISDVISQMINGWVDIAKDTWIFNIQGNKEIAPSLLFMIQAGVPVKQAIYLSSMPMVRDYVREQRLAKSTFAEPLGKAPDNPMYFRNKARGEILANPKYGFELVDDQLEGRVLNFTVNEEAVKRINEVLGEDGHFDETQMRDAIAKFAKERQEGKTHQYSDTERAAFLHFLEVENMSKAVRDIKLKMNFDTTKSGTLFEAQNRILMKESLKQDARMPSAMVDDIIENSPIGSFYVQPFQLEIWKGLFSLRNHDTVNKFLLDKIRYGKNDVDATFGDAEVFANEFRNDLVSFIFQNNLKDFNLNTVQSYRGYNVDTETSVEEVTNLRFGAFVKDGVMYVDKRQLARDYKTKAFKDNAYADKGLAKVSSLAFENDKEYFNFVFEREHLRYALPLAKVKELPAYQQKRNVVAADNAQHNNENVETYGQRIDKLAYEVFLRDSALDNTFNSWKLFKSDNTYADQFNLLKTAHPELADQFAIVKNLSVGTSRLGFANLRLNDTSLDGDTINLFHENLLDLANPNLKKVDNALENERISDFFSRFPLIAFLQSGLNTKGAFSMVRIVPQDSYLRMMEGVTKDYTKHFTKAGEEKLIPQVLEEFYDMFVARNSAQFRTSKYRHKNYSSQMTLRESQKMLDEGVEREIAIDTPPIGDPLATTEAGLMAYNPQTINAQRAKRLVTENPDKTFIYNFALNNQKNAVVQDWNFHDTNAPTVIGMPTRLQYAGGALNEQIKDVEGAIAPTIKTEIDAAIEALKEQRDAGQTLVFSRGGYGQYMIGASDRELTKGVSENAVAPKTFLYLSQKLFEEFGYVNPNYLATKTGRSVVQSSQVITDKMVEDFMNHCG